MPRYSYKCMLCDTTTLVYHGIDEIHTDCEFCGEIDSMMKLLTRPTFIKTSKSETGETPGRLTEEYIQKNREVLEIEKQEAKKETYEPS